MEKQKKILCCSSKFYELSSWSNERDNRVFSFQLGNVLKETLGGVSSFGAFYYYNISLALLLRVVSFISVPIVSLFSLILDEALDDGADGFNLS